MKKVNFLIFVLLLSILVTGCSKDNNSSPAFGIGGIKEENVLAIRDIIPSNIGDVESTKWLEAQVGISITQEYLDNTADNALQNLMFVKSMVGGEGTKMTINDNTVKVIRTSETNSGVKDLEINFISQDGKWLIDDIIVHF